MIEKLRMFVFAVLAGACIGLGGIVFLSVDSKVLGAALFAVGLFTICAFGLNLFTGKVCYVFDRPISYVPELLLIWIGNYIGTWIVAQVISFTRNGDALCAAAKALIETKQNDGMLSLFILGIFCNILIYIAVSGYKNIPHELGKYLAIFFGVMVFILSGFEHCVADMFYFNMAGALSGDSFLRLIVITAGNATGSVIFPLADKIKARGQEK